MIMPNQFHKNPTKAVVSLLTFFICASSLSMLAGCNQNAIEQLEFALNLYKSELDAYKNQTTDFSNKLNDYQSDAERWREEFDNKLNDLKNEQTQNGNAIIETVNIPTYWHLELNEGVKAINQAMSAAGNNKSAFLFYSDSHWNDNSKMSPLLLKYLYLHTGMTKTIFGGDIVANEGTDYETMSYLWEWRSMIKDIPNHHSVVGNHDDGNATDKLFSEAYVYNYLLAPEETPDIVRDKSGLYYYIDAPLEKTRYLYLDTAYKGVDTAQIEFVKTALKSVELGWHIIAISHIWYYPDYEQNIRPIPVVGFDKNAELITEIFDSYNARKNEFAGCAGKVEFCIGGHVHRDYVGATPGGIPIVLVETDSSQVRSNLTYEIGTISESSINGIVVDYTLKKAHVIRVGRGESFSVDLRRKIGDNEDDNSINLLREAGFTENARLSYSSGILKEHVGTYVTGFIPINGRETDIYLKNIVMPDTADDYKNMVACYDKDQNYLAAYNVLSTSDMAKNWDEYGNLSHFILLHPETAYIRICAQYIDEASVITIKTSTI